VKKWIVLLVVCLSIATLVSIFLAQAPSEVSEPPAVNEGSTPEPEFGTPGLPVGRNTATEDGIPHWWCWSKEGWPKFQWYANETEVIWEYNETTGEKMSGEVMVAGEPLFKVYSSGFLGDRDEENAFYGFGSISPVKYLEGERKGNCGGVSIICYCLFTTQGETVLLTSAQTVNNETGEPGLSHTWVEWTDSDNSQWVIDSGNVIPLENWYQSSDWTHSWVQWKPGEYRIFRDGTILYYHGIDKDGYVIYEDEDGTLLYYYNVDEDGGITYRDGDGNLRIYIDPYGNLRYL